MLSVMTPNSIAAARMASGSSSPSYALSSRAPWPFDVSAMPAVELKALVAWSYDYAWNRLTERQRVAIRDEAPGAGGRVR